MPAFATVRRIRLPEQFVRGQGEELARDIHAAVPACTATYDSAHHKLILRYDRARTGWTEIEPVLERHHVWPPSSWTRRLWRAWILYTEANLRDHLQAAPAACCSRPPRRPGTAD